MEEEQIAAQPVVPRHMNLNDAIDIFTRSYYEVLIFRNEETNRINVLHRTKPATTGSLKSPKNN